MADLPSANAPVANIRDGAVYLTTAWFRYLSDIGGGSFSVPAVLDQYNAGEALTLTTPNPGDPIYDGTPIAALKIAGPPSPTTRNFEAGLWIITEGGAIDKGRGILLQNIGASDGLYIQCDGANCTGEAILLTASSLNATGMVIGTIDVTHVGLVLRQETAIDPSANGVLMQLQADGSVTEMMRVGSTLAGQNGIVFRFFGANAIPMQVLDNVGTQKFVLTGTGAFAAFDTNDNFIEAVVKHGATSIAANNAQVVTVANVGPGGAGIAIQEWLKVRNAAGTLRYIPMFG